MAVLSNPATPSATFFHLDWLFEQEPDRFLGPHPGRPEISCTAVSEYLQDTVGLEQDEADQVAFDWAEQPQYAHLSSVG